MYSIIYYWTERGDVPVKAFIALLQDKTRQKIEKVIDLLSDQGPFLRRPYADKIRGPVYELRIHLGSDQLRILYAFIFKEQIILLHIFRKKTNAIPSKEIELAENRLNHFRERYDEEA